MTCDTLGSALLCGGILATVRPGLGFHIKVKNKFRLDGAVTMIG
jgi:hypothetical protein